MARTKSKFMKPVVSRIRPRPSAVLQPIDEAAAAVRGELARCTVRTANQAEILESIGARTLDLMAEVHPKASSSSLVAAAHEIRGLVLHALTVTAELQGEAGRLDALAAIRAALAVPDSTPDNN